MRLVYPGESVQAVLDASPEETIYRLAPGTYDGALTIRRPLTLQADADTWPRLTSRSTATITVKADDVQLQALGVTSTNPDGTLVDVTGGRFAATRCELTGSAQGQHRGVALNGDTAWITHCQVTGCWLVGRDAQAIMGWDGTRNVLIEDCYLSGGAETVMFGGADSKTADRTPTNLVLRRCLLTKDPTWYGLNAQIKNALELKNARNVLIEDCELRYAGTSQGQGAFLIVLTPRNQGGTAPWSGVENVVIRRCTGGTAGGVLSVMGSDDGHLSEQARNIVVRDCTFDGIDPTGVTKGRGRVVELSRGPASLTLERITVTGAHLKAAGYFIGVPPTGLVLRDLTLPPTTYGWKIDAGGSGLAALQAYAPGTLVQRVDGL